MSKKKIIDSIPCIIGICKLYCKEFMEDGNSHEKLLNMAVNMYNSLKAILK